MLNALLGNFKASPDRQGLLFEHFIFNQIISSLKAQDQEYRISNYRTEHGAEVDIILETRGQVWAIEVKASRTLGKNNLTGLKSFSEYFKKPHRVMVIYLGSQSKKISGVEVIPWQQAFKKLAL